jgi:hypothetical protein
MIQLGVALPQLIPQLLRACQLRTQLGPVRSRCCCNAQSREVACELQDIYHHQRHHVTKRERVGRLGGDLRTDGKGLVLLGISATDVINSNRDELGCVLVHLLRADVERLLEPLQKGSSGTKTKWRSTERVNKALSVQAWRTTKGRGLCVQFSRQDSGPARQGDHGPTAEFG